MKHLFSLGFWALAHVAFCQGLFTGGPMLGDVDFRSATIWVEAAPEAQTLTVTYRAKPNGAPRTKVFLTALVGSPAKLVLEGLEMNTAYGYEVLVRAGQRTETRSGSFATRQLWQWRQPPPNFSFLAGSCAYFNEPAADRPGAPYGKDSSIFEVMAREQASFMLWLGDNWYTREVDYGTATGLRYRAAATRSQPVLQNFWKAMPHYAIWDDHDYGPDNADLSYPLKQTSRAIFENYWCNPSFGQQNEGIYTKLNWHDVELFLLDDRWFRSNDALPDSVNGQPNPEKLMLGRQQMTWLKNALAGSQSNPNISFRIIALGSQVLNPLSTSDCLQHFPTEYAALMNMLNALKIEGVVFLTGDRHLSEIIAQERPNAYPLYDVTTSPLTAGPNKWRGAEVQNPARVAGVEGIQSFGRFSVSGEGKKRALTVEFVDKTGVVKSSWSVLKTQLAYPK
jgi:alkaline phosphatase D